jgi:hypothetical protein
MYTPRIETDIPLADYPPTFNDLQDRVDAAFASLAELGDDIPVSDDDIENARKLAQKYASSGSNINPMDTFTVFSFCISTQLSGPTLVWGKNPMSIAKAHKS